MLALRTFICDPHISDYPETRRYVSDLISDKCLADRFKSSAADITELIIFFKLDQVFFYRNVIHNHVLTSTFAVLCRFAFGIGYERFIRYRRCSFDLNFVEN